MHMLRRSAVLAIGTLLTAGMAILGAASASAQTPAPAATPSNISSASTPTASPESTSSGLSALAASTCPSETFCGWQDLNYGGTEWNYNATVLPTQEWLPVSDCTNYSSCPNANDAMSSLDNNRVNYTFIDKNYPYDNGNNCSTVPPGSSFNLDEGSWASGGSLNDSISGVRLTLVQSWTNYSYCY
jgi:hypothetical protein